MAAISSVVWSSCPRLYYSAARRRRSSLVTCSNGPRPSNSDPENSADWDTAWQNLKEKKQALESASRTEIAKVERSPSDVEDKYADMRRGRDVGPSFTKLGGGVRGGKYQMGQGADRILEFWGNADAALYASMAVIILMLVLLSFIPAAPM